MCRAWRQVFTSRPSLWSDFDCEDTDKTHVYLERSKSSPIDLRLRRVEWVEGLSPLDPFLQVVPRATTRLRSLDILGTPENLRYIAARLSHPAPLLTSLTVGVDWKCSPEDGPTIPITLFDRDLSSLRELRLNCIRTELPWRNMANLTSFTLRYALHGNFPISHLLDFFEATPRLREVHLHSATPTSGAQNGRLVSLPCLKRMVILGGGPTSLLLNHLLIPAGAKLTTQISVALFAPAPCSNIFGSNIFDGHLPRSLNNLRNLSSPTEIHLHIGGFHPRVQFSGPNGQVNMIPQTPRNAITTRMLESLLHLVGLDTSKVERLRIYDGNLVDNGGHCTFNNALISLESLRTLTISRCTNLSASIPGLSCNRIGRNLEELVLDPRVHREKFDIQTVIDIAATRASAGSKLKSIRIVSGDKSVQARALELWKYVEHVECSPGVAAECDESDSSDESDGSDEGDGDDEGDGSDEGDGTDEGDGGDGDDESDGSDEEY